MVETKFGGLQIATVKGETFGKKNLRYCTILTNLTKIARFVFLLLRMTVIIEAFSWIITISNIFCNYTRNFNLLQLFTIYDGCVTIYDSSLSFTIYDSQFLHFTTALVPIAFYILRQVYYNLRQLLQFTTSLLQFTTVFTIYDNFYNLRQHTLPYYALSSKNKGKGIFR